MRPMTAVAASALLAAALVAPALAAGTFFGDFAGHYTGTQLAGYGGSVSSLLFEHHARDGVFVTEWSGRGICRTTVNRDAQGHVTGINNPSNANCVALPNTGLWSTAYLPKCSALVVVPFWLDENFSFVHTIRQYDPETNSLVRSTDMSSLGLPGNFAGSVVVVPDHWSGAGKLKALVVNLNGARTTRLYEIPYTIDAGGLAVLGQAQLILTFNDYIDGQGVTADGVSATYIDAGSQGINTNSMLFTEQNPNNGGFRTWIADVDQDGNPIMSTMRQFVTIPISGGIITLGGLTQDLYTGDIVAAGWSAGPFVITGTERPVPVCCQTFQFQQGGCGGRDGGILVPGNTQCNLESTGPCEQVCCNVSEECMCEVHELASPCASTSVSTEGTCLTLKVGEFVNREPCSLERAADEPCPAQNVA